MISALILTHGNHRHLSVTLASLIPGITEGVLRDGIILDASSEESIRHIAGEVGCAYLQVKGKELSAYNDSIELPPSEWLLCLTDRVELEAGWFKEAQRYVEACEHNQHKWAVFLHLDEKRGFLHRLTKAPLWFLKNLLGIYSFNCAFLIHKSEMKLLKSRWGGVSKSGGLRPQHLRGRSLLHIES